MNNNTLSELIKTEYKSRFNKELTDTSTLDTLVSEASHIQDETYDLIADHESFIKFSVMYAFDRVFNTDTCMDFLPLGEPGVIDGELSF